MSNNKFQFTEEDINNETGNHNNNLSDKVEEKEDNTTIKISHGRHFSFEERIIVSVIAILILFVGACFLGMKVIKHTAIERVPYTENGDFNYQVCLKTAICVPENTLYNSENISTIKLTFKYHAKYKKKIKYNKNYRITSSLNVYSKDDHSILYQKDVDLVKGTTTFNNKYSYSITEIVTIDYIKYKELVNEYNNADKQIEVIFYLDEGDESRKVSSLMIPLSKDYFELNKHTTINAKQTEKIKVNIWDTYSLVYGLASSLLTIISLVLIYRTTSLVLKVTNNKSEYEETVDNILKEYDSIIVVSQDGYEDIVGREIIKVDSFDELVKVKDNIDKPIIFSKINNVKCEFIVEDEKLLYKYVLKEADFTEDDKIKLENK